MTAAILCLIAFGVGLVAGARSLAAGLAGVLTVAYSYGILRANVRETASHFIFDAAVLGLYLTQLLRPLSGAERERTRTLLSWLTLLIAWPVCLMFFPLQHPFVQLVGLRGNVFLVPFLLLGARLTREGAFTLGLWVGVLNLAAFGFAVTEYFVGIERFYPPSEVTRLIYLSRDVDGYRAYRIPACFTSAGAYGGAMAATFPWILGAWMHPRKKAWQNHLLLMALFATILGVFMSASRSAALLLLIILGGLILLKRSDFKVWFGLVVVLLAVGYFVASEKRLQRFTELQNTDYIGQRIHYSVNTSLLDAMIEHPLGNGLGGGGTSIPYFLQHHLRDAVKFENEYARIAMEQGLPGLALWVGFIGWVLTQQTVSMRESWGAARWLLRLHCATLFGLGLIGTGLFSAIPETALWCTAAGWVSVAQPAELAVRRYPRMVERVAG